MQRYHKAKKSLGQNFLKSEKILGEIIKTGEITKKDIILEIGPGRGALTEKLLQKAKKVVAIEKDIRLVEILKEKFSKQVKSGSLVLINDDILKFDISRSILNTSRYKIIANIPYNITGAILKKFLTAKRQPKSMVLMVQYDVAKRIIANNKKESILSISVKAYGTPKMIMKVPPRYFSPKPKVDSAILSIKNISKKIFTENNLEEKRFWNLVLKGFSHKRKKLGNNLRNFKEVNSGYLMQFKDKRAENLSLDNWLKLIC